MTVLRRKRRPEDARADVTVLSDAIDPEEIAELLAELFERLVTYRRDAGGAIASGVLIHNQRSRGQLTLTWLDLAGKGAGQREDEPQYCLRLPKLLDQSIGIVDGQATFESVAHLAIVKLRARQAARPLLAEVLATSKLEFYEEFEGRSVLQRVAV